MQMDSNKSFERATAGTSSGLESAVSMAFHQDAYKGPPGASREGAETLLTGKPYYGVRDSMKLYQNANRGLSGSNGDALRKQPDPVKEAVIEKPSSKSLTSEVVAEKPTARGLTSKTVNEAGCKCAAETAISSDSVDNTRPSLNSTPFDFSYSIGGDKFIYDKKPLGLQPYALALPVAALYAKNNPRYTLILGGLVGLSSAAQDAQQLYYANSGTERMKYGSALAMDASIVSGGTLMLLGKVPKIGAILFARGMIVRFMADLLPNRIESDSNKP